MKSFTKGVLKALSSTNGQSGLGFGCMGITAFYGKPMEDANALELLQSVYDAGCHHFDTAEVYQGEGKYNESVLGEFFKKIPRDSYTVATKYWPNDKDPNVYSYESVKKSLTASLERLQLDYVDLYYAHRVLTLEGGKTFAETAKKLQAEGLIKEIGLSEVSGKWLKQINAVHPIDAVQQEWSLLTRNLEDELVPVCKELGIVIVAYSPLARNMLAKKNLAPPDDWRASQPRYNAENLEKNNRIVDTIQALTTKYDNCSPAQLSLAWLFHKANALGVAVVPIPGSTKIKNVQDNLGSVKISISDADSAVLESLSTQVAGERGNEWYVSMGIESQT